jgi:FlaA1/EpsC-like NDP-sugar epimerase
VSRPARNTIKFVADLTLWTIAGMLAFPLRVFRGFAEESGTMLVYAVVSASIGALSFAAFRLQRQSWREVSLDDLLRLLQAISAALLAMFAMGVVWYAVGGFPRTVPLIQGAVAVVFMGGARLAARLTHERRGMRAAQESGAQGRVLVVGAGSAGTSMARDMRRHPAAGLSPVGFLDDSPSKRGMSFAGLPVLGTIDELAEVVATHDIDEVLIAMPSSPGRRTRRVVDLAREAGVACRILPGVTEILLGNDVRMTQVRAVQVEDLLRRAPIQLDLDDDGDYVSGGTVLVTGAGGSIGSELVRQAARLDPKRVVLLGQGENSLHVIQRELRTSLPDLDAVVVVGNVQDDLKMHEMMETFRPEVVFHAAAHKQVPLLEHNPDEAVLNNVGGTHTVAGAALEAGVRRFVNISTDKAVNPVSMLGVTKAIAERVVLEVASRAEPGQVFVSVRFGNVLGSRGSVVPIFQDQIDRGGPVTITDPAMTRYFMTIPEASRLVMQAGSFTENGAVYVLDMGSPVRIEDLARDMIRLSGRDGDEIEIVYTGLRPGEKLEEELFTEQERTTATRYEQILVARSEPAPAADLAVRVEDLLDAARRRDWASMDERLGELEPGFRMGAFAHLQPSPL